MSNRFLKSDENEKTYTSANSIIACELSHSLPYDEIEI